VKIENCGDCWVTFTSIANMARFTAASREVGGQYSATLASAFARRRQHNDQPGRRRAQ
jgi:hypothetical protein